MVEFFLMILRQFSFCPDRTISICAYNLSGIVHDSTIAEWGGVYKKLKSVYEETSGMPLSIQLSTVADMMSS